MHLNADLAKGLRTGGRSRASGSVMVVCPGGLEHGGGIGRQMGYFLDAGDPGGLNIRYTVVDSRGKWFLGASPAHAGLAVACLAWCLVRLTAFRWSSRPGIAHVNITGRGSTFRKLAVTWWLRVIGLRYLLHVHDYDYAADHGRRGAWMKARVRGMFRRAEMVIVLGEQARTGLLGALELEPARVRVLHNAVPDPLEGGTPVPRAGLPFHIVFLGHLSARKGVPELLQALGSEALSGVLWRATLAGGGPVEAFREHAVGLGLTERVAFTGWIDQDAVHALCMDADILVLPSHAEGLAMSVLEGLAHGLAVVTTPVGAHLEVIEAETSGLFVPAGDAGALAAALLRVMQDRELRERLQAGARLRFLEGFCVRDYARRLGDWHGGLL